MPATAYEHPAPINNGVLRALPERILERLRPNLRHVELQRGSPVNASDGVIVDVYFVNLGSIAVLKTMHDGHTAQIRTIGIEGLTDPWALFGVGGARLDAVVQIPGSAFQVNRNMLMKEMAREAELRALLRDYSRFAIGELARTSACNCLHGLEARCCRLLLVSQDNAMAESFELTQEHLAAMLGVQRGGVTIVAGNLKRAGLIDYSYGRISILDRRGLEQKSCECYLEMRSELDRIIRRG